MELFNETFSMSEVIDTLKSLIENLITLFRDLVNNIRAVNDQK